MDEQTRALILRTHPLTETSLIVQWLTRDFGRISTVAKGALRAKSPFRGKLDLFYLADISFQRSRTSELHTLREVSVKDFHAALRQNVKYLQQAAYFVQLIEQATETDTPLPEIFNLATAALAALSQGPPRSLTIFAFEIKLLNELGLQPGINADLSLGAQEILKRCERSPWPVLLQLKLAPQQTSEISKYLNEFLSFHLSRTPAGRAAALAC
jgi:DNA repair protein RecO (recombination protein O)